MESRTINPAPFAQAGRGKPGYWRGISVWLFAVLLAVFAWAVHRRLAQYDSVFQDGHHMTATRLCLTERPQTAVPTEQTMRGPAMLLVFLALAFALLHCDRLRVLTVDSDVFSRASQRRTHPGLTHFFFFPPPAATLSF